MWQLVSILLIGLGAFGMGHGAADVIEAWNPAYFVGGFLSLLIGGYMMGWMERGRDERRRKQ